MIFFFFFFKQNTAYELRISVWSSDVCSSDLIRQDGSASHGRLPSVVVEVDGLRRVRRAGAEEAPPHFAGALGGRRLPRQFQRRRAVLRDLELLGLDGLLEIGRASCRERVGQYV